MLWVKAFHVIFVVCWFAGLFYLPRLYVYHAIAQDEIGKARFKIMERKLYFGIATPSMLLTLLLGAWLISYNPAFYLQAGWLHAKLASVALLVGYHAYLGKLLFAFKHDRNKHSDTYYRIINEIPVLFLIIITVLVVVKPF